MGLTVKRVARFTEPGRYFDNAGLYLIVESATNRYWTLRYQLRGTERWMGLGSAATFSLEEARQRARKARQLLADGIDPLAARHAEQAKAALEAARNKTFNTVAQEFFDAHSKGWSRTHRTDFMGSLKNYAYPIFGNLPVAAVDETLVLAALQPIWAVKTVTAKRVMQRIAAVLDYAKVAKYRVGDNPAKWEGHLEHLLAAPEKVAEVKHHPEVPYAELPAFMRELRAVPGIAAKALEFLILTGVRSGEVRGAVWTEINLETKIWTIPAERMKAKREHRVPLSRRAVALLRSLPREGERVFIGYTANAVIGDGAMRRVLQALRPKKSVHGFRSSLRTWAEERTKFPNIVAEMAIAHTVGSAVERAYRRGDLFEQRTKLMQQWAEFCDSPVGVSEAIPLRRARA